MIKCLALLAAPTKMWGPSFCNFAKPRNPNNHKDVFNV